MERTSPLSRRDEKAFANFRTAIGRSTPADIYARRVRAWLHNVPAADREECLNLAARFFNQIPLRLRWSDLMVAWGLAVAEVQEARCQGRDRHFRAGIERLEKLADRIDAVAKQLDDDDRILMERWPETVGKHGDPESLRAILRAAADAQIHPTNRAPKPGVYEFARAIYYRARLGPTVGNGYAALEEACVTTTSKWLAAGLLDWLLRVPKLDREKAWSAYVARERLAAAQANLAGLRQQIAWRRSAIQKEDPEGAPEISDAHAREVETQNREIEDAQIRITELQTQRDLLVTEIENKYGPIPEPPH